MSKFSFNGEISAQSFQLPGSLNVPVVESLDIDRIETGKSYTIPDKKILDIVQKTTYTKDYVVDGAKSTYNPTYIDTSTSNTKLVKSETGIVPAGMWVLNGNKNIVDSGTGLKNATCYTFKNDSPNGIVFGKGTLTDANLNYTFNSLNIMVIDARINISEFPASLYNFTDTVGGYYMIVSITSTGKVSISWESDVGVASFLSTNSITIGTEYYLSIKVSLAVGFEVFLNNVLMNGAITGPADWTAFSANLTIGPGNFTIRDVAWYSNTIANFYNWTTLRLTSEYSSIESRPGVHRFSFEEINDVTPVDSIGAVAVVRGSELLTPLRASGKVGNGIYFHNNASPNIYFINTVFHMNTAFSIEFWTKINTNCRDNDIISSSDGSYYAIIQASKIKFSLCGYNYTTDLINDGNWHHIIMSYDGIGKSTIYVDTVPTTAYVNYDVNETNVIRHNIMSTKGISSAADFYIDELSYYQYELSPIVIKRKYLDTINTYTYASVRQWKLKSNLTSTSVLGGNGTSNFTCNSIVVPVFSDNGLFLGTDNKNNIVQANIGGVKFTEKFSIDGWIYITDLSTESTIFSRKGELDSFRLWTVGGNIMFNINSYSISYNAFITANTWYHVGFIMTNFQFYLNGIGCPMINTSGTYPNKWDLSVGVFNFGPMNGKISEWVSYDVDVNTTYMIGRYNSGTRTNGGIDVLKRQTKRFSFEETDGNYHATNSTTYFTGGVNNVSGKIGKCFQFDQTHNGVIAVNPSDIYVKCTDVFSIEFWHKAQTSNTIGILLEFGDDTYYINIAISSQIAISLYNTAWYYNGNADTNWHHYIITHDGSQLISGLKLYIDNILKTPTSTTQQTEVPTYVVSNPFIGLSQVNGPGINYVDELCIYNGYCLQSYDVAYKYNSGNGTLNDIPYNIVPMEFQFEELTGTYSGTNTTTTLAGTVSSDSGGKIGKCLKFTNNDAVNSSNMDFTLTHMSPFSIEFWYKADNIANHFNMQFANDASSGIIISAVSGHPSIQIYDETQSLTALYNSYTINTSWHHYVLVWAGSIPKLYIDSVLQTPSSYTPAVLVAYTATLPTLTINNLVILPTVNYYLDELVIYQNYVMDQAHINFKYNSGNGTRAVYGSNAITHFAFGSDLVDSVSGNASPYMLESFYNSDYTKTSCKELSTHVLAPNAANLSTSLDSEFSYEIVAKLANGTYGSLVKKGNVLNIYVSPTDGYLHMDITSGSHAYTMTYETNICTGAFRKIYITRTSTTVVLYIDNNTPKTIVETNTLIDADSLASSSDLQIGNLIDCSMKQAIYYDRVLTAQEILKRINDDFSAYYLPSTWQGLLMKQETFDALQVWNGYSYSFDYTLPANTAIRIFVYLQSSIYYVYVGTPGNGVWTPTALTSLANGNTIAFLNTLTVGDWAALFLLNHTTYYMAPSIEFLIGFYTTDITATPVFNKVTLTYNALKKIKETVHDIYSIDSKGIQSTIVNTSGGNLDNLRVYTMSIHGKQ